MEDYANPIIREIIANMNETDYAKLLKMIPTITSEELDKIYERN